ncbi:MAG: MFS transporter [Pseudomonadota bacterium]
MIPKRHALGFQYFIYFGTLGIALPFFNLYLSHAGFTGLQIGLVSAVKTFGVMVFPVFWALAADRLQARRFLLILCTATSAVTWVPLQVYDSFPAVMAIMALHAVFFSPVIAFIEAFSMDILGSDRQRYGQFRVWGSLGFILVSSVLGKLLDRISTWSILPMILAGLVLQTLIALAMPSSGDGSRRPFSLSGIAEFFTAKISVFLTAAFLMLASHGAYYGFLSIHLEALGFSSGFIGMAWALASVAEVSVMLGSAFVLKRMSMKGVLVLSFVAATLRWILLFAATAPWLILVSQCLHALSYGAFHVASILAIETLSPPGSRTLGQAVNNSVTYGAGMMAGFLFAGLVYDTWGRYLFLASAVMSLAGGILMILLKLDRDPDVR